MTEEKPKASDATTLQEATHLMHQDTVEDFHSAVRVPVSSKHYSPPEVVTQNDLAGFKTIACGALIESDPNRIIKVKKLTETAKLPVYAESGAACADLFADEDVYIDPGTWHAVKTGLAFEIPDGFEVQVRARSGLAFKYGVAILNGVGTIDSTYRGEIKAVLINHHEQHTYHVEKGDRIAQIKISKAEQWDFEEVEQLSETDRGEGGFGSTGK